VPCLPKFRESIDTGAHSPSRLDTTAPAKKHKAKKTPTTVSDFTILPLTLPTATAVHYAYIKPHTPSTFTPTAERSLFVANVPVDATESALRSLFATQLGGARVERVEFDASIPAAPLHKRWKTVQPTEADDGEARGKKRKRADEEVVAEGVVEDEESALPSLWAGELRRSGSGAIVVFVDKRSARGAMKEVMVAVKEGREVKWVGGEGMGVERMFTALFLLTPGFLAWTLMWIWTRLTRIAGYKSHNALTYPPAEVLQASINAYLSQFTALEHVRNKLRKTARSVPDEDGFITVTRGGRAGPARMEEAEAKKAELEERRKNNGVKDDFYRFQNREKRKEAEVNLRKRFEEDRRRVERMRERRGRVRPER
jgi:ribosomal RNA-processing protein 7